MIATNTVTGCVKNMTGSATVAINPLPVVYTVTGGGSYCVGGVGVSVGLSGSITGKQLPVAFHGYTTGRTGCRYRPST